MESEGLKSTHKELSIINEKQEKRVRYHETRAYHLTISNLFFQLLILLSITTSSNTNLKCKTWWAPFSLSFLGSAVFIITFTNSLKNYLRTLYALEVNRIDQDRIHLQICSGARPNSLETDPVKPDQLELIKRYVYVSFVYLCLICFADLPEDRTLVWSANRNSLVGQDAILELDNTGNLILTDGKPFCGHQTPPMQVFSVQLWRIRKFHSLQQHPYPIGQSFSHPSHTPSRPIQPTSVGLALTYILPASYDSLPRFYRNYSNWSGPDISNATGDVVAVLNEVGSLGVVCGQSSDGAVCVYKKGDTGGLSSATNQSVISAVLRRLVLETNGNLRLYRWDNDVNGSRQWVPEWAAVSNPCDIAGVCGNGICNLDRSKTNASCTYLPGTSNIALYVDEYHETEKAISYTNVVVEKFVIPGVNAIGGLDEIPLHFSVYHWSYLESINFRMDVQEKLLNVATMAMKFTIAICFKKS
ncbi:S-locus glycoprotein domain [Dillenia turbinata]|uniref:S-locus glycoprotein domain n=1 Tax=Dillenia turbinata TaxID=194707 RepID=A0AAN8Z844_9MAGN